ncbi:hypothetical protein HY450_01930 [Candidatus Pacearchaeota archaeon]|nr:hypothetical protein [Candidatus Pacearchaeota archaeon]
MEQNREQIILEYKVTFEDGFRPAVHVYGVDPQAGKVYYGSAGIGVGVGAGNKVSLPSESDRERNVLANIAYASEINCTAVIKRYEGGIPECEDWEEKNNEHFRQKGYNVIKVQSPEHIQPAIERHVELYRKQFEGLARRFEDLFCGFIVEHPWL